MQVSHLSSIQQSYLMDFITEKEFGDEIEKILFTPVGVLVVTRFHIFNQYGCRMKGHFEGN